MNAIEMRNVTKQYRDFSLNPLNLSLPSGCILGLIGENGAGKSTTIKLILNLIRRDSGEIFVLGKDTQSGFDTVREDIGVVLDEAYFPESITAKQVNAVMKRTYKKWDEAEYFALVRRFSLPMDKPFKNFSRGMKMKLAIAVALSHHAKLLILDEATSGLDPIVRDEIVDLFYEFTRQEDHSILISSHILSDLEKLCDYVAFLHRGRLLFCEEKDRLSERFLVVSGTKAQLESLDKRAVCGVRETDYGTQALIDLEKLSDGRLPANSRTQQPTLEEIIIFLAKGGNVL